MGHHIDKIRRKRRRFNTFPPNENLLICFDRHRVVGGGNPEAAVVAMHIKLQFVEFLHAELCYVGKIQCWPRVDVLQRERDRFRHVLEVRNKKDGMLYTPLVLHS